MSRPICASVDLEALQHNLTVVRRLAPRSKTMAVIKANGYGHGMLRVAHALPNADGFAVLQAEDAVVLREEGIDTFVLLLEGAFCPQDISLASQHQLAIVVHSEEQLVMLEKTRVEKPVSVFLKINTGMNRLGVPPARFWAIFDRLKACKHVSKIALMSHFADAENADSLNAQITRFNDLTGEISLPKTLANSAALLINAQTHLDWVRPGIVLYGASPLADQSAASLGLQPAMTLSSAIIDIQRLQAGDAVGYGGLFVADKPMNIGVVACGYADGYPRNAPTGTPIAVAGKRTRTLGRVSMDMLCVDLDPVPEAVMGSPVELWGKQISVDEVAAAAQTLGYELLCAIATRVPVVESQS